MNIVIPPWVHNHLLAIFLGLWVASNLVMALPSPGPTSSAFYKWAFGSLHAIFGSVPRLVATLWPGAAKFFTFGNGNQEPPKQP